MERGAGELKNDGNDGKGNKEYFACSVLNHRCNTIQLGLTKRKPVVLLHLFALYTTISSKFFFKSGVKDLRI